MIKKYKKKPVVIEAIQFNRSNHNEIKDFVGDSFKLKPRYISPSSPAERSYTGGGIYITTLEGDHLVSLGDFVIKGIKGEFYPCKPDIFKTTYEEVANWTKQ